jgi:hypothetical protein
VERKEIRRFLFDSPLSLECYDYGRKYRAPAANFLLGKRFLSRKLENQGPKTEGMVEKFIFCLENGEKPDFIREPE